MNSRRHGSTPAKALWMLIAAADLGLLATATSVVTVLLVLAGLVLLAGGVIAARPLMRRAPEPARAAVRRRA
jgi:hypothetical protein